MSNITTTQTSATGQDIVAALVQKQLIAKAKLIFTIQDESARATKGAKSVSFPRTGNLTPAAKSAGTASTGQVLTYAADQLALNKHYQTLVILEDSADVQTVVDVESDIIERSGAGMALQMDTDVYTALRDGASSASPDHIIDHYSASGTLTLAKVLEARKLLDLQNVPEDGRFMAINPDQEGQLLALSTFVSAQEYGSDKARMNGEVGSLFGFRVIKTTVVEDNVTLYYHNTAAAFARQIDPKFESMRDLENLAWKYSLSCLYGVKVLDSGKRNVTANATGT